MRRHVRRHRHRDPTRAVDQKIRHPRRQHLRLRLTPVKRLREIHALVPDVRQQPLLRQLIQSALRVTHRRRRIVVQRPKVPVSVHQRRRHRKILRQPHQRLVHRSVPVRVILPQHVSHHSRALSVRFIRPQSQLVHAVQDPSMHRLQPVARVRQRSPHDHAHRVRQVRRLRLARQFNVDDLLLRASRRRRVRSRRASRRRARRSRRRRFEI
mmetsp:Transcript_518/g.2119  ORF Transcript_518/g.2119 Transcript_518/m.2119 type:complete len:211 (-) Transcript_518:53-685(-)